MTTAEHIHNIQYFYKFNKFELYKLVDLCCLGVKIGAGCHHEGHPNIFFVIHYYNCPHSSVWL